MSAHPEDWGNTHRENWGVGFLYTTTFCTIYLRKPNRIDLIQGRLLARQWFPKWVL